MGVQVFTGAQTHLCFFDTGGHLIAYDIGHPGQEVRRDLVTVFRNKKKKSFYSERLFPAPYRLTKYFVTTSFHKNGKIAKETTTKQSRDGKLQIIQFDSNKKGKRIRQKDQTTYPAGHKLKTVTVFEIFGDKKHTHTISTIKEFSNGALFEGLVTLDRLGNKIKTAHKRTQPTKGVTEKLIT